MSVPVSLSCAAQDTGRYRCHTGSTIQTRVDKKESSQLKRCNGNGLTGCNLTTLLLCVFPFYGFPGFRHLFLRLGVWVGVFTNYRYERHLLSTGG